MIGKTNVKGGKAAISLFGAANETVTYTGKSSGSVTLGADGTGTVTLPTGNYTFTAGVSGMTATIKVKKGVTVMLRPEHFVYWYGVEAVPFGDIWYSRDWGSQVTRNTNSIVAQIHVNGNGYGYHTFMTENAVDLTPYSSLKALLKDVDSNGWQYFAATTDRTTSEPTEYRVTPGVNAPTVNSIDVSGLSESRYVGITGVGYVRQGPYDAYIYAIWME